MTTKIKKVYRKSAMGFEIDIRDGESIEITRMYTGKRNKTSFEIVNRNGSYQFQIVGYFKGVRNEWINSNYPTRFSTGHWVELMGALYDCVKYLKAREK